MEAAGLRRGQDLWRWHRLHAEITTLGYRGSLRTVYRYLQPLRTGTDPSALTPSALTIGEVTSWLLRRTQDLNPRQQLLLAYLRGRS